MLRADRKPDEGVLTMSDELYVFLCFFSEMGLVVIIGVILLIAWYAFWD